MTIEMSPEKYQELAGFIAEAVDKGIEKHVNGGVREMHRKLDDHVKEDKGWKKKDAEWKEEAKPVLDMGRNVRAFGKVTKAVLLFMALVGGLIVTLIKLWDNFKVWFK